MCRSWMCSLMSTDIAWEQIFAFILDRAPSGVIPFKVHATCKNSYVLNHSNLTRTWHELFTVPPGFQPIPMNQGGLAILDRDRYVHSSVCFERLGFSKLSKFAKIFFNFFFFTMKQLLLLLSNLFKTSQLPSQHAANVIYFWPINY